MSEPNSPLNSQEHSSNESSLNWWNPFPDLSEETDLVEQDSTSLLHADSSPASHQTNVKNADAKNASLENFPTPDRPTPDRPTTEADAPANGAHVAVIAAWSEGIANQTDPPNLADLISLIQELNQCNGVLLDRVSQLEEALERSQQALQVQGERSTEPLVAPHQAEDLTTAQAQIANLFSQLEFAHQANQRQQILTETLTAGLESSQERVAQLEREAALLQQRYNEQSQRLVQSEGSCRDLQARLQRQQRYTLQFKAALEKCLEMPAPQYEGSETIAPPTDVLSLPKAQQIQPWSTPGQTVDPTLPWMKLHAGSGTSEVEEAVDVADLFAALEMTEQELIAAEPEQAADEPVLPSPVKMASLHLPTFTETTAQTTAETANLSQVAEPIEPQAIETGSEQGVGINEAALDEPLPSPDTSSAPISYNLKDKSESVIDPALIEHLSTTVQPLADMLAEAMLAVTQPAHPDSVHSDHHPAVSSLDAPQAAEPSIETTEALVDDVMICDPDALLASAMNEAEDALWQDLARLIEVSTEDVVKASLSGDLAAFESINFGAIEAKPDVQSQPDRSTPAADSVPQMPAMSVANQPTTQPVALSTSALTDDAETESSDPNSSEDLSPLSTNLSWPSPLLNPLRPPKGKRSLSHVELPSFVRQEPSNPIVT